MMRAMIRLLLVPGCLLFGAISVSEAQLRAPVTGNAQRWVQVGCDPCCFVTNLHAERAIQATLFTMTGRNAARVAPRATERFPLRNDCMKGGMGLEVQFAE